MTGFCPRNVESAGNGNVINKRALPNAFRDDWPLRAVFSRIVSAAEPIQDLTIQQVAKVLNRDLQRFGDRVVGDLLALADECERIPPHLQQFDEFGKRVDILHTSHAWKKMHNISAQEGLVALGYNEDRRKCQESKKGKKTNMHFLLVFLSVYLFILVLDLHACINLRSCICIPHQAGCTIALSQ